MVAYAEVPSTSLFTQKVPVSRRYKRVGLGLAGGGTSGETGAWDSGLMRVPRRLPLTKCILALFLICCALSIPGIGREAVHFVEIALPGLAGYGSRDYAMVGLAFAALAVIRSAYVLLKHRLKLMR
jgi:hypothetical protein